MENGNEFLIAMGGRIAERRKQLRLTQEQLAERMDVSLQTVSCVELGKKAIRPENLARLCGALDVSADYILLGRRDSRQMSEMDRMLSGLSPDEYALVRSLAAHFAGKK